jgi:hypothetical protein
MKSIHFVSSHECDAASADLLIISDGANVIDITASAITSNFIVISLTLLISAYIKIFYTLYFEYKFF